MVTASSTVLSWKGSKPCARPALFTRISTPPKASIAAETLLSTSSRLRTSRTKVSTRTPYSLDKRACTSANTSERRPEIKTLSPYFAYASAIQRPIPDVAPVTKTLRAIKTSLSIRTISIT